jgi:glycosyltransferase involved in cell wall biosynthesis
VTGARPSLRRLLSYAIRHPLGLLTRLRARKARAAIALAGILPAPIRQAVARPLARAAEWQINRHPRSRVAPPVAFVAHWALGARGPARRLAIGIGTSAASAASARRRLALLAMAFDQEDVATSIADSLPTDRSAALELLRARLAFGAGRYQEALDLARAAAAAGADDAGSVIAQVEGQLTVLRPGWLPALGRDSARLRTVGGRVVRGRVLHLVSVALPYRLAGYTVRTQAAAKGQLEAGLDPHVATRAGFPGNEGYPGVPRDEVLDGVPYHHVAPDFRRRERLDQSLSDGARAAVSLIEELRPAVLQPASNYLQAQTALALAGPLGVPVVYEVRGFWEESFASRSNEEATGMATDRYRLTREVETSLMLEATAIVTLSETMRGEIIARGCRPERVVVVPNAGEVDRFRPLPRDDALADSLGIARNDPVIGYISSLNAYEGIPYLLEAAARLRVDVPQLRVLVVGDGDERDRIVEAGRRLGLDDGALVMPGQVPHDRILGYYSILDVFVVPRTANRVSQLVTPLKPFEAMAMQRATVVSDLPALREIVIPGETGMTFRAEDADDLARVLGELLTNEALRTRLGRQAREWIVAERTWTQNGRRYRDLFEELDVA